MSYSALSTLPFANTIMQAPYQLLPILLHTQANGLPRAYKDSSLLAKSIEDGRIVIDDLRLPWRPQIDDHLIDLILCDEPAVTESFEHRRLKVDARILALAVDPGAQLQPEASASHDRHSLRADLLAWHAAGVTETYECGVTDGPSVPMKMRHFPTGSLASRA